MTKRTPITARILVTGATGFIGAHVLEELANRGALVHAVSRNTPATEPRVGVVWHRADLLDSVPAAIIEDIRPSHCLHLAWEATPGRYRTAPENYDWATASVELARAFYRAGGESFTMAGSCAEYVPRPGQCDELRAPLADDCAYAICKVEAARQLASLARDAGARFACGRIFNVYGPAEPPGKLVASICQALAAGRDIALTAGADVLDYIYLTDVCRALVLLALSRLSGPVNIGTGQAIAVRTLAQRLGEIAGRPELLKFGAVPADRQPVTLVASTARLTGELGFQPGVSLDSGLRKCYEFWQSGAAAA